LKKNEQDDQDFEEEEDINEDTLKNQKDQYLKKKPVCKTLYKIFKKK
jgi:hypothetical protein